MHIENKVGNYEIEFRRWPTEAGHAVAAGIEGDDVEWRPEYIQERDWKMYTGGVALSIRWAQQRLGGRTHYAEVDPESIGSLFSVNLDKGIDHLYASFHDKRMRTIAPYYIYVRKLA